MSRDRVDLTGMEIRPGLHVICVPTIWKLETGDDTAEEICRHVAEQMFGEGTRLFVPESVEEGHEIFRQALERVEAAAVANRRSFEVMDPIDLIVRIGGESWKQSGLRWVRVVRVPDA